MTHASIPGGSEPLHSYLIVRSDLPLPAQMAQCAHAAQQAAFSLGSDPGRPIHVVILACDGEPALLAAAERLARKGFEPGLFFEPDWPRGHTALHLPPQPRSAKLRAAMGAYPLWRAPDGAAAPIRAEPTDDPLNARVVIEPGAETFARICHLLHKVGMDLSDRLYHVRDQAEKAGLKTADIDHLNKLCDLIEDASPEGWSQACECPESGYAQFLSALSEGHAGDCTACPCSCVRCHAESALGLSTRPATKREGYRLFQERLALRKARGAELLTLGDGP